MPLGDGLIEFEEVGVVFPLAPLRKHVPSLGLPTFNRGVVVGFFRGLGGFFTGTNGFEKSGIFLALKTLLLFGDELVGVEGAERDRT